MAQSYHTMSLREAKFPMLSENQPRTTILNGLGQKSDAEHTAGIAYMENVMPTEQGLQSVGYIAQIPAASTLNPSEAISDTRIVYGSLRNRFYLAWATDGTAYIILRGTTSWIPVPSAPGAGDPNFDVNDITIGTVNGISYIYLSGVACFFYDETAGAFTQVVLQGLVATEIVCIAASSGYLVAFTADGAIAWSSTLVPTDFIPSEVTGAGGGIVAGLGGELIFAVKNTLGILIFTESNCVAATYTSNARFPFKFREVKNSKGAASLDQVAYESNSDEQYIYSTGGLQSVTSTAAENILPDVTDFLGGKRFEAYNYTADTYITTDISQTKTMLKKLKFVSGRYLVISYGLPTNSHAFTHALVYDTALGRTGKIALEHTDVFEYIAEQSEVAKQNIAFLTSSGAVQLLDFSQVSYNSSGILVLGKLQASPSRLLTLLGVEVEDVAANADFNLHDQVSLNGKTFNVVSSYVEEIAEGVREYLFRSTGKNHSLVFKGKFNLNTALVRYINDGRR